VVEEVVVLSYPGIQVEILVDQVVVVEMVLQGGCRQEIHLQ
jgi:hypothetical protein